MWWRFAGPRTGLESGAMIRNVAEKEQENWGQRAESGETGDGSRNLSILLSTACCMEIPWQTEEKEVLRKGRTRESKVKDKTKQKNRKRQEHITEKKKERNNNNNKSLVSQSVWSVTTKIWCYIQLPFACLQKLSAKFAFRLSCVPLESQSTQKVTVKSYFSG